MSIKYWKGVINDKFGNIDFIHLCWLLAELDKQISSVQGGDYCRRTFSPGFVKNLWLISQSWADRRTTEAKTLAANCGPSTSYLRPKQLGLTISLTSPPSSQQLSYRSVRFHVRSPRPSETFLVNYNVSLWRVTTLVKTAQFSCVEWHLGMHYYYIHVCDRMTCCMQFYFLFSLYILILHSLLFLACLI